MKTPLVKESSIQHHLIKVLGDNGWWVQKVVGQSRPGLPDLVSVKNGKTIWIEVKRDDGKLKNSQIKEITSMKEHGAIVVVVVGMQGVKNFLKVLE